MSEVIDQGPTLEEEVKRDIEILRELPARTQGRRVGAIVQSGDGVSELVLSVAQGWEKVNWTLLESRQLQESLESEESRLDRWVTKMSTRLRWTS